MRLRLCFALAAGVLLLHSQPAASQEPATPEPGIPTVVLIDQSLAVLNYLSPSMSGAYARVDTSYIPAAQNYSTESIIGAGLGGMIVETKMREDAQIAANLAVHKLVEPLGKTGLQGFVRQAFREGIAQHGMTPSAVMFTGGLKLDARQFARIPAAKASQRFMLVGYGAEALDIMPTPVAMDESKRQLRLALDIEIREGRFDRNSRVSRRDVVFYTQPLAKPETGDTLDVLGADGHARLRAELNQAVVEALTLATSEREFPDVAKDDRLGVIDELGLTEFPGVLVEEKQGRALIWTRHDSLVSIPASQVVTGEALVAARLEAIERSKPVDILSDEYLRGQGRTNAAPDAPAVEPEA